MPVVLAAVLAAAPGGGAEARGGDERAVMVFFTRGELFGPVERELRDPDAPLATALGGLLAGPTAAERARGFRSAVPAGTALRSVSIEDGVATVDLSARFAAGGSIASVRTRLAQLVFTATQFPTVSAVRLMLDGRPVQELRRIAVEPPLRRVDFGPPPTGAAAPPPQRKGKASAAVRRVQERLIELGYLAPGSATGFRDDATVHATLAFQGWEGLARDAIVGPRTRARLARAERPAVRPGTGRRIEVSLARQVALVIDGSRLVRAIHVSTGASASPTPPGRFRVFRKEVRSWSVPFQTWLPWASYFNRGIAFHEYPEVPAYPASHGCVRVPAHEARFVYRFARIGTLVVVS